MVNIGQRGFKSKILPAILILGIFLVLDQSTTAMLKLIFPDLKGYNRWAVRMAIEVSGSLLAVMLLYRSWAWTALKKMALIKSFWLGLGFAFIATLPTSLTYAFSSDWQIKWNSMEVLFYTILSPFSEEVLYRGFAFWMLFRYAKLGFWPSAILPAMIFGLAHMSQSNEWAEQLGIIGITAIGGLWFSWLLMKWENLWVPIFFHIFLNFWFEIFDVGVNALGDWVSIVVRAVTVILSIVITIKKDWLPFHKILAIRTKS